MDTNTAKNAAKKAVEILVELIPDAKYTALEGIELNSDGKSWKVIVGYVLSSDIPSTGLAMLANTRASRSYKVLVLSKDTLELEKMEPYHVPTA